MLAIITLAHAAPPADATPEYSEWFQGLRDANGASCCNLADCRPADYRFTRNGIEARTVKDGWVLVPTDKILPRTDNPTGFGILCWDGGRVLCFVRATEG